MTPSLSDRVREAALMLGTGRKAANRLAAQADKYKADNPHISYSDMHQMFVTKAAEIADGRKE